MRKRVTKYFFSERMFMAGKHLFKILAKTTFKPLLGNLVKEDANHVTISSEIYFS